MPSHHVFMSSDSSSKRSKRCCKGCRLLPLGSVARLGSLEGSGGGLSGLDDVSVRVSSFQLTEHLGGTGISRCFLMFLAAFDAQLASQRYAMICKPPSALDPLKSFALQSIDSNLQAPGRRRQRTCSSCRRARSFRRSSSRSSSSTRRTRQRAARATPWWGLASRGSRPPPPLPPGTHSAAAAAAATPRHAIWLCALRSTDCQHLMQSPQRWQRLLPRPASFCARFFALACACRETESWFWHISPSGHDCLNSCPCLKSSCLKCEHRSYSNTTCCTNCP